MTEREWIEAQPYKGAEQLERRWVDLAQPRLGSEAIYSTDEFFAPRERLLRPGPARFFPDRYDDHGQWMDGWESRRRRGPGHDWCVIRLGRRGRVRTLNVDTSFFSGNFPTEAMVEVCDVPTLPEPSGEGTSWRVLLPRTGLRGDCHNIFECADTGPGTHLRLHIYPDGGVARLRAYGAVEIDWHSVPDQEIDLAATVNGGRAVAWNDAHYGLPSNLLVPGPSASMGDGWETARRRVPGNDWAVVSLGHPGVLSRALVGTTHFKGNYPDRCSLKGALLGSPVNLADGGDPGLWTELLPETQLRPDDEQEFRLASTGLVDHVRLDIHPDGGISRLRLYGRIAR